MGNNNTNAGMPDQAALGPYWPESDIPLLVALCDEIDTYLKSV
jgi:hypothetical protein